MAKALARLLSVRLSASIRAVVGARDIGIFLYRCFSARWIFSIAADEVVGDLGRRLETMLLLFCTCINLRKEGMACGMLAGM